MVVTFSKVYPRVGVPLSSRVLGRFPFYFDSRREFFEGCWEEGFFEEGSVAMLLGPRIFGKTSFINMLPKFLEGKGDGRSVFSQSCMRLDGLDRAAAIVDEMLRGGGNRVLVLDEMNYAFERRVLRERIVELAGNVSGLKGRGQTIILTTSETSSPTVKKAFDILHPGILRLPALNEEQTKMVAYGVLRQVTGGKKISRKVLDLVWRVSGGIPPYVRMSVFRAFKNLQQVVDHQLARSCMFDFSDRPDAVKSCVQTLTACPVETAKMSEGDLALMADRFCLSCPIKCRRPSVKKPVVDTALAERYGLLFTPDAIASPIAFYYNDYLGRKRFEEFSSDIVNRGADIRAYSEAYCRDRRGFVEDVLLLLEIAFWDPEMLYGEAEAERIAEFLRGKAELVFLERSPRIEVLADWMRDFGEVCKATVYGDRGIDLEVHNLRLSTQIPPVNSYVQCKNWRSRVDLEHVGIFHKFEMVLRSARQVHAAILVSTSEITDSMREEAEKLTAESRSVFCCWSEPELTAILGAICGNRREVQEAIKNLSSTNLPPKMKGGALEFLTLKTFSVLADKATQK